MGAVRRRKTLADFVKPEPTPDQALAYAICATVYGGRCACAKPVNGPCACMESAAKVARSIVNEQRKPDRE